MGEEKMTEDKDIKDLFPPLELPVFDISREPCHNFLRQGKFRSEILQDLKRSNLEWMKLRVIPGTEPFGAVGEDVVFSTHHLCQHFELSHETFFLALELFDRYVMKLLYSLYRAINIINNKPKTTAKSREKQTRRIMQRISDDSVLRLLSTIQIASKFTDRDKVLSPMKIAIYLSTQSKVLSKLSLSKITESEVQVCKTLGHKLHVPTVYVALETLLGLRQSPQLVSIASQTFAIATQMTHMLYIRHRVIYNQLASLLGIPPPEKRSLEDCSKALENEVDNLWAAAALIVASVHFADASAQELAIEELAFDLQDFHNEQEIRVFAWLLMKAFIKEMSTENH